MKRYIALFLALMLLFLAGCGGKKQSVKEMDMQSVYDAMVEEMPEMLVMDENMMLNFCGIQADMCKQAVVAVCSDGLRADEVWLIEAADEAALEELKDLADGRLQRKGEESITYSPEQYKIVEAAQVITAGNYLAVIVSPDADALAEIFNQAAEG